MIGTGSMTDPYIPLEMEIENIRKSIKKKCVVQMTLTTYDKKLCKQREPNVCTTSKRVEVLKKLRDEGISTVVWLIPILPFINDTEENIASILEMCRETKVYGIYFRG